MRQLRWRQASPGMRWFLVALLLVNAILGVLAIRHGRLPVEHGPYQVTNGYTVALGVALTLLAVLAIDYLPFPAGPVARAEALTLGAQVLHASGHLFGLYSTFPRYDELLHFGLTFGVGLVVFDFSRSRRFLFTTRLGPVRTATLVAVAATAVVGLWEVFEFTVDAALRTREQDDLADTMMDMVVGTAGAVVAGMHVWRTLRAERRARQLAGPRSDELLD